MLYRVLFTAAFAAAAPAASAAEQAMLILDGSGSMWGQVGGKTKIAIAREAVGTMLARWDPAVELGLIVYGHRRKGDCADIEVLTPPATLDPAAFSAHVDGVTPVGMTPISAAVRLAAQALRSTEQKATVILVSDGLETCDADPCALGADLEASGVDFTAHVIGFDVAGDSEAGRQLACLAERSGGRYLEAERAEELGEALSRIGETVAASGAPAASTPAAGEGCLFYDDDGHAGTSMSPTRGTAVEYIGDEWNDRVRSVRCATDCRARLWLHADFHSEHVDVEGDAPDLGELAGSVSAYHVVCGSALPPVEARADAIRFNDGCTAYDQPGFAGNRMQMGGAGGRQVPDVPEHWRNGIRSLSCEAGCGILVFTEPGYDGANFSIPDGSQFARMPDEYTQSFGSYEVGCSALLENRE